VYACNPLPLEVLLEGCEHGQIAAAEERERERDPDGDAGQDDQQERRRKAPKRSGTAAQDSSAPDQVPWRPRHTRTIGRPGGGAQPGPAGCCLVTFRQLGRLGGTVVLRAGIAQPTIKRV
jgi:hypothetical protein